MEESRGPTLCQLRLLLLVRRVESLGAAARALGVSQPTASRRARELEQRCALELFDRGMYTTFLSRRGERIANQAQRVLEEYERLLSLIGRLSRCERGTTLGFRI